MLVPLAQKTLEPNTGKPQGRSPVQTRLAKAGTWRPRLLALSEKLGLDQFEEDVVTLLVGYTISPVLKSIMVSGGYNDMTVYQILNTFCESFEDQVC